MNHAELVQVATDLLFDANQPERWLSHYDLALASQTDQQLNELVMAMQQETRKTHRLAA